MATSPSTPSAREGQSTTVIPEATADCAPANTAQLDALLALWVATLQGQLSQDCALGILEHGVDGIQSMYNAINQVGEFVTATISQSFKQLPPEERRTRLARAFKERIANEPRTPGTKRSFEEVSTPSTGESFNSSRTISSSASTPYSANQGHINPFYNSNKRPRILESARSLLRPETSSSSGGSARTVHQCPFCNKTPKNTVFEHIQACLLKTHPSLSAHPRSPTPRLLLGCGCCPVSASITHHQRPRAFSTTKQLTQHLIETHTLSSTKLIWDTTNALTNVLNHPIFAAQYAKLCERKYPGAGCISWRWGPATDMLLRDLEIQGGRFIEGEEYLSRDRTLDYEAMRVLNEVVDAAQVSIQHFALRTHTEQQTDLNENSQNSLIRLENVRIVPDFGLAGCSSGLSGSLLESTETGDLMITSPRGRHERFDANLDDIILNWNLNTGHRT